MGRVYLFTCERCEYQARVSGGADDGYHCVTQTVACADCRALYDAAIKLRVAEKPSAPLRRAKKFLATDNKAPVLAPSDPTNRLLFGEPPKTKWVSLKLSCPVSAQHRVERWNAPGKCPRCGNYLERGALPFRVWD